MGNIFSFGWEDQLIIFIQRFMSPTLIKIAGIITEFGDAMILVGVIGLFYWSLNKELGKKLVVYLGFVNIVNTCVKSAVKRLRPYMANADIQCLKPVNNEGDINDVISQEFSFPSGHANNSMSIYGTIAKNSISRIWKAILIILILLNGISRFVLGVHYPTDVIAGWIVACVCIAVYGILEKKLGRYKTYILLDVIGIVGFFIAKSNDFYTGYGIFLGSTLGIMFEEKTINFEGTKKVVPVILRTAIGAGLYVILNTLMKLPFSNDFLNSGTVLAFSVRAVRYAIIGFLLIGIYPMAFQFFGKRESHKS